MLYLRVEGEPYIHLFIILLSAIKTCLFYLLKHNLLVFQCATSCSTVYNFNMTNIQNTFLENGNKRLPVHPVKLCSLSSSYVKQIL